MPLAPSAQAFLDLVSGDGPELHELAPEQAREAVAGLTAGFGAGDEVAHVEDLEIPGPAGPMRARAYRPAADGPLPLLVYMHGGGWMLGGIPFAEPLCRKLAARAGLVVVSLDYPLAPERPFPAAIEATDAALVWLHEHAAQLGADPARIAVGGDSAGGNLASALTLIARERGGPQISFQVLLFASMDLRLTVPSLDEMGEGYFLTRSAVEHFVANYVGDHDLADPRISPMCAADHAGLPPAFVATAEFDPVRDDGEAYAEALRAAGGDATVRRFDGQVHSFLVLGDLIGADADAAIDEVAAALRAAFA